MSENDAVFSKEQSTNAAHTHTQPVFVEKACAFMGQTNKALRQIRSVDSTREELNLVALLEISV